MVMDNKETKGNCPPDLVEREDVETAKEGSRPHRPHPTLLLLPEELPSSVTEDCAPATPPGHGQFDETLVALGALNISSKGDSEHGVEDGMVRVRPANTETVSPYCDKATKDLDNLLRTLSIGDPSQADRSSTSSQAPMTDDVKDILKDLDDSLACLKLSDPPSQARQCLKGRGILGDDNVDGLLGEAAQLAAFYDQQPRDMFITPPELEDNGESYQRYMDESAHDQRIQGVQSDYMINTGAYRHKDTTSVTLPRTNSADVVGNTTGWRGGAGSRSFNSPFVHTSDSWNPGPAGPCGPPNTTYQWSALNGFSRPNTLHNGTLETCLGAVHNSKRSISESTRHQPFGQSYSSPLGTNLPDRFQDGDYYDEEHLISGPEMKKQCHDRQVPPLNLNSDTILNGDDNQLYPLETNLHTANQTSSGYPPRSSPASHDSRSPIYGTSPTQTSHLSCASKTAGPTSAYSPRAHSTISSSPSEFSPHSPSSSAYSSATSPMSQPSPTRRYSPVEQQQYSWVNQTQGPPYTPASHSLSGSPSHSVASSGCFSHYSPMSSSPDAGHCIPPSTDVSRLLTHKPSTVSLYSVPPIYHPTYQYTEAPSPSQAKPLPPIPPVAYSPVSQQSRSPEYSPPHCASESFNHLSESYTSCSHGTVQTPRSYTRLINTTQPSTTTQVGTITNLTNACHMDNKTHLSKTTYISNTTNLSAQLGPGCSEKQEYFSEAPDNFVKILFDYQNEDGDSILHILILIYEEKLVAGQHKSADDFIDFISKLFLPHPLMKGRLDSQNYMLQTPVYLAVQRNLVRMTELLVNAGADIRIQGRYEESPFKLPRTEAPLHTAVRLAQKGMAMVEIILDRAETTCVNIKNSEGETPLHIAALEHGRYYTDCSGKEQRKDSCQLVLLLLEHGADMDAKEYKCGKTPLMVAIESKDLTLVNTLLDNDHVHARKWHDLLMDSTRSLNTCMHIAAGLRGVNEKEHVELIRYLLKKGGDADLENSANQQPRDLAPSVFKQAMKIWR